MAPSGTIDLTTVRAFDDAGIRRRVIGIYTGPASYATGGDQIDPGDLKNLGEIEMLDFAPFTDGTTMKTLWYNHTTGKVLAFDAAGTQTANGTNLSTYTARFEAIGK